MTVRRERADPEREAARGVGVDRPVPSAPHRGHGETQRAVAALRLGQRGCECPDVAPIIGRRSVQRLSRHYDGCDVGNNQ